MKRDGVKEVDARDGVRWRQIVGVNLYSFVIYVYRYGLAVKMLLSY